MNETASNISAQQLLALLPIIALGAGAVAVMLIAAFARGHRSVAGATAAVLVVTLCTLPYAAREVPTAVTTLMVMDNLALFAIALLTVTSLAIVLFAYPYFQVRAVQREEFYLLLLFALLGCLVLVSADHFITLLLGLELLGVSLFCLAAYNARDPVTGDRSIEAGMKYLVLSGLASALLLFGMALIYAQSGQLHFAAIRQPDAAAGTVDLVVFYGGSALLLAGLSFKLSLVPFHLWTPDVYQGAPLPVSAVIATLSKGAIFIAFVRYVVSSNSLDNTQLFNVIVIIAALSMLVGNWLALLQDNIKRLLGYSSIAHLGYLLVAFLALQGSNLALALEACAVYLAAYLATIAAAFGVVAMLSCDDAHENDMLQDLTGLFWRRPLLTLAFTLALLSLAGIPLTVGFIGKFYLFSAGANAGLWTLLGVLIIGSGIGLYYYLRLITALFKPYAHGTADTAAVSLVPGYLAMGLLSFFLLVFGVYPQPLIEQAQAAADNLQQRPAVAFEPVEKQRFKR
ncbi:NADH-quinone oxidoreductase subunit N [Exilibacterium tricleocarpae]|uniref:NADH-quinone oxidoreductase subunit N n=1 Tax=Exilibacterium tricleocarpae TaxID=2591008 RepID=A0A545T1S9_9GAMM|nr:NADH-quinone oxidoreductase subunit N [Exilibacterium tricleocarpae]TQV71177.1 NADH-quinone oxidoreductase subunit N [Exilibacterium tricleocarpae]